MLVLHVNWVEGALRLWAESLPAFLEPQSSQVLARHPFAVGGDELAVALAVGSEGEAVIVVSGGVVSAVSSMTSKALFGSLSFTAT